MDTETQALRRSDDPATKPALIRRLERSGMTLDEATCEAYGFDPTDTGERETDSTYPRIRIGGELFHVTNTRAVGWGGINEIETEEGEAFILSEDSDTAGEAAKERWADMASNDPTEFAEMVGKETLVAWALGQWAGPGSSLVQSLAEWLDLIATAPEEEWAGYDGEEREVDRVGKLAEEIGFVPTVAYRSN